MVRTRAWASAVAAGLVMAGGIAGYAGAEDPSPAANEPSASSAPGPSDSPSPADSPSASGSQSAPSSPSPSDGSASPSDSATSTVGPGDAAFLSALHQGDLAEIGAGRDALPRAAAACVMRVGEALLRDRAAVDSAVTTLGGQLRIGLPQGPNPAQNDQLARISRSAGTPGYDTQWLQAQSAANTDALRLLDQEIASGGPGDHAKVVTAAQAARRVVAHHLAMVRACHPLAGATAGSPGPTAQSAAWKAPNGRWSATDASVVVVGSLLVIAGSAWATRRWHRSLSR